MEELEIFKKLDGNGMVTAALGYVIFKLHGLEKRVDNVSLHLGAPPIRKRKRRDFVLLLLLGALMAARWLY